MSDTPAYSPAALARRLMRGARTAALATLDAATGAPFASLVTVATDPASQLLLLLSTLAAHTRNLAADPRASLLIDDRSTGPRADALAGVRLTLIGRIGQLGRSDPGEAQARYRFLARHPEAAVYAGFRDFAIYRMSLETAHLVAGFGRINDLAATDLLVDLSGAEDLVAAEAEIVDHMNADHAETTRRYATALLGEPDGPWQVVGCDPFGLDLAVAELGHMRDARLEFGRQIRGAGPLRAVLKELAEQAGKAQATKSI